MSSESTSYGGDPVGATVVALGLSQSRTVVFDGGTDSLTAGDNEDIALVLLHLGSGEELRLRITNEQADEVISFYLSALGAEDGDPSQEGEARVAEAPTRETEGRRTPDPEVGGRSRASVAEVLEL